MYLANNLPLAFGSNAKLHLYIVLVFPIYTRADKYIVLFVPYTFSLVFLVS